MKPLIVTIGILLTAAAVSSAIVLGDNEPLSPKSAAIEHVLRPTPTPAPAPRIQSESKAALPAAPPEAEKLETDLAELQQQIERGEYVRLINDPATPPAVKAELRAKIRRFARLTMNLARLQLEQLEKTSL